MKSLSVTLISSLLFAFSSQASVVGYWEFEDGAFLDDSSGNGNTLTNVGSMAQVAIPGSGNGSAFPTTIPQTGASNGSIADFTATSGVSGFSDADNASYGSIATSGAFTIEAFINSGSGGGSPEDSRYIAAQYDSGSSQRSWGFQVNQFDGMTVFLGDMATFWESPDTADGILSLNTDYYVAVSFDIATDDAIFYWQNLTGAGTLQSQTVSLAVDATSLGDPTLDFTIGHSAGSTKRWDAGGFIDSVRLSNTALSESELLVSVPEPSIVALMLGAAAGLFVMLRRRRA
ncbi:MAG: PEP-CTERM sorting domain-containing protein [Oceanipulchritudo sp.]